MKHAWLLGLAFAAGLATGQDRLEILALKHRPVDQVIAALTPLLEKGGSLSGANGRLIVRTSPRNLEEIRRALAAIDTPLRSLRITVMHDNEQGGSREAAELSGSVGGGAVRLAKPAARAPAAPTLEARRGDNVARARVYSSRGRADERMTQQVHTVEGAAAFIQLGYSFPLPLRQTVIGPLGTIQSESIVYRDLSSGFYARASLAGDRVTVEIAPQLESLSAVGAGAVHAQRLSTTVNGRLGEWIELGGTTGAARAEDSATASYSTRGTLESRRVLLKVEELR